MQFLKAFSRLRGLLVKQVQVWLSSVLYDPNGLFDGWSKKLKGNDHRL